MVNVKRYGSFNDALRAFKKQSKSIREEYKQHTAFVPENEQRRQKRSRSRSRRRSWR